MEAVEDAIYLILSKQNIPIYKESSEFIISLDPVSLLRLVDSRTRMNLTVPSVERRGDTRCKEACLGKSYRKTC